MHTAPDMTDFLVRKTSTLRNTLAYRRYHGSQQQHSLTLRTYLYWVILKKFQFSRSFIPRFNLIQSMVLTRGGRIDPNIDSIDTNVGIGIGSILAW